MSQDLKAALLAHEASFGIELSGGQIDRLAAYYGLVMEANPLLHLVGPSTAEEFATRHILESLTLLHHLPQNAKFADVGPGAGLPSIPCLLVREDLSAILIETKEKKASFLYDALEQLGLRSRTQVANKQYSETDLADAVLITTRALDKLSQKLPHLIRWAGKRRIAIFAGGSIKSDLERSGRSFEQLPTPMSDRRYLYILD